MNAAELLCNPETAGTPDGSVCSGSARRAGESEQTSLLLSIFIFRHTRQGLYDTLHAICLANDSTHRGEMVGFLPKASTWVTLALCTECALRSAGDLCRAVCDTARVEISSSEACAKSRKSLPRPKIGRVCQVKWTAWGHHRWGILYSSVVAWKH